MQRVSKRASERVLKLVDRARVRVTKAGGTFLWPISMDPDAYEAFREPTDDPATRRDADDIPCEEVANAALHVLKSSVSLSEADLVRETARTLGFQRTGRQVQQRMCDGIEYLVQHNRAERRNEQIILRT